MGPGYEPITIPVTGSGAPRTMHIVGKRGRFGLTDLSSGSSDDFSLSPGWAGELEPSTVASILKSMRTIRTRSIKWVVRFDQEPLARALQSHGLSHRRMPVHILPLGQDHEAVFALHNATVRNHIRKAERRGVKIREASGDSDLKSYQQIYRKLADENGWRFIYPARLTSELTALNGDSRFLVAEHEGNIIGGALFLRDSNSVYYMHGATDRTMSHLFPSSALLNGGIKWACEIGADFFNFGNSGKNESLARFKASWGAEKKEDWVFDWDRPLLKGASSIKGRAKRLVKGRRQAGVRWESGPPSWEERAKQFDELAAVCYAGGSDRKNLMMHGSSLVAAEKAVGLMHNSNGHRPRVLDFGCGTGRMVRFFANHKCSVVGMDITPAMLEAAQKYGVPDGSFLSHFDGQTIPLASQSLDLVWISGVLKYTLLPPDSPGRRGTEAISDIDTEFVPTYPDIAKEMFRVLKPGGLVVNCEMWVDSKPEIFTPAFEEAGFETENISVLRRYLGRIERILEWRDSAAIPSKLVLRLAKTSASLRSRFDDPNRVGGGFRDYLFVWRKPSSPAN